MRGASAYSVKGPHNYASRRWRYVRVAYWYYMKWFIRRGNYTPLFVYTHTLHFSTHTHSFSLLSCLPCLPRLPFSRVSYLLEWIGRQNPVLHFRHQPFHRRVAPFNAPHVHVHLRHVHVRRVRKQLQKERGKCTQCHSVSESVSSLNFQVSAAR